MKALYTLEWIFYTYLESKLWIIGCAFCTLLSITVVWSETTFWISNYSTLELSILYWWLNAQQNMSVVAQWIVIFIPVWYIAYTAYWSMFELRIMNYYRLLPHQLSDANSILFSAYYVCRLTAPMVYNFLLMIHDQTSAFYLVNKQMNLTPLFGSYANAFLPLCLVVLCLFNILDVYSWLLQCFCFKRFKKFRYDEDFSDERIDQGKDIVANEKSLKERGLGLSIDQETGSLLKKEQEKECIVWYY